MKKLSILLIAFVAATTTSFAQSSKAESLVKEVTSKIRSYNNVSFTYKGNLKNSKANQNIDLQGKAILSGDKYNVDFMGSTIISDGKKQYTINREDEQVTISTIDNNDADAITPTNMLTFFEKGYKKDWDKEENIRGRKIQFVKLTPTKSSEYSKILLGIDVNTKHVYNLIMTEKSGTVITFTMNEFKTNVKLPQNAFSFNSKDYSGYDIERI